MAAAMPEIHFTRVVSVSSADPRYPAENLLRPNDGGRWRGAAAGEKQLSVVLELGVSSPIHSVHIGNDGAAFVEILQGASGGGEFQVLLPTSALMSPAESRAGLETRRVRVFGPKNLVQNSTQSSYDRLRVVLSQPYCQSRPFGLSFIRVFSAPEEEKIPPEAPLRRFGFFSLREEEEVGEGQIPPGALLFRRPSPQPDSTQDSPGPSYALAALGVKPPKRRLASQKSDGNLPKKQPKLPWAPNSGNSTQNSGNSTQNSGNSTQNSGNSASNFGNSASNSAIFAQNSSNSPQNSSPKSPNSNPNPTKNFSPKSHNSNPNPSPNFGNSSNNSNPNSSKNSNPNSSQNSTQKPQNSSKKPQNSSKKPQNSSKKPQNSPKKPSNSSQNPQNSPNFPRNSPNLPRNSQNSILSGVTLALSGFQNPLRSQLREAALELGAKYCPDWSPNCTHLVCAFPRTPKASQARQDGGILIGPQWIWDCQSKGRRLACGPYLLDGSAHSGSEEEELDEATPPASPTPNKGKGEGLEEATPPASPEPNMGKGEEPEEMATPIPATPPESGDSDSQSDSDPYAGSTEENSEGEGEGLPLPQLPDFFQNKTFFFHGDFPAGEERKLRRFAVAFGGSLAPYMDDSVTHVVTNQLWSSSFQEARRLRPSLVFVRPDWLLQSGERQRPLPVQPFAVQAAE